jgi:hypothetical protein
MKQETRELSSPPCEEIIWVASANGNLVRVKARTWFSARAQAAILLGCSKEEIRIEMERT